jgi:hypothetical protein
MKLTLIIATLAVTAFAAPHTSDIVTAEANIGARADNCFFASQCATFWSGKCENHCGSRGFSHMSRDGCSKLKLAQKCCCKVA